MNALRHLTSTDHTSFFGRLLRFPLRIVPSGTVVRIATGLNKGLKWICGSSIQRCWFGTYEFDKQDFVAGIVKPGMTVWDVGANVGFYTLAFSRLVGASGAVFAFEPLAANVAYLLRHIELNSLSNVTVIQAALSDTVDLVGFSATRVSSIGAISERNGSYLLPTLTAENVISRLPKSSPDLIKLDVEGAEAAILCASKDLLDRHSPDILLALHGAVQEQACSKLLTDLGYRLFSLDGVEIKSDGTLMHDEVFATRGPLRSPPQK
jgi:FkbM family methyltransferase